MSFVLVFTLTVCLCYFLQKYFRRYLVAKKIAGLWAVPLLGNIQALPKLKPEYLFLNITENRARFKETFRLWLGPQLWVFLHSAAETRDALNDSSLVRADTFHLLNALIGNGLLISEGKHWETHRRILGPAFHPNILNSFTPDITNHAIKLANKIAANYKDHLSPIEVGEYLFPCLLDIIIGTSMGKNLNAQDDANNIYAHAFHIVNELLFKRMINPLLAFDFVFKYTKMSRRLNESLAVIHNLMESVINERAAYLETLRKSQSEIVNIKQRNFLDILLTAKIDGQPLTFQEIRDEVNTFVLAGVDTTCAALGFILYALAKYPEEQLKIYEEIQNSSANATDINFNFTTTEINGMENLDMFIKECLRFYTIVPMTGRQTTKDTKIGHIQYCAGITIWINMYGLAHDGEYFESPHEFRPDRFSKQNLSKLTPFSYLPFSGGPHVCIGRKYANLIMKILIVKILQNFQITTKDMELVLMAEMVLKSLHGINLIFEKRVGK